MTMRFGAIPAEWNHFSLILGLTEDLLPVVSNPNATISPESKMRSLGKTPSRYNKRGHVGGIKDWTSYHATASDIANWSNTPDYGICLQTRSVRALDCDITNTIFAKDVYDAIARNLNLILPARRRSDAAKFLLGFTMPGEFGKRTIRTEHGIIEFLATGQQFIAAGTHPDGARYEWDDAVLDFPTLTPEQFERLWAHLEAAFGVEPSTTSTTSSKAVKLAEAAKNDPVALRLIDKGAVISTERDGRIHIICPFAAEHTGDSGESATTYFPAFTGGFERGHFRCLHAHCAKRTDAEFLNALNIDTTQNDFEVITAPLEDPTIVSKKGNRYVIESLEEFARRDPPTWIVKSVLPESALGVVFGESGSGKTFFVLDLGFAVARGVDWRGLHVKQGRVVYIAAEDARGVGLRASAYLRAKGIEPVGIPFGILAESPDFTSKEDVAAVLVAIRAFGPVTLIVVDTWAQVTPGSNENSGEDMGKAMAYCRSLHQATGALVLLIHHSGKDASKGARGWSGLRAAADCEIEITRSGDEREAQITKLKNAADGARYGFRLTPVPIGADAEGEVITSCVLEHVEATAKGLKGSKEPKGAVEKLVARVAGDLTIGGAAPIGDLIDAVKAQMAYDPAVGKRDKRREHIVRAIDSLHERGVLGLENGVVSTEELA